MTPQPCLDPPKSEWHTGQNRLLKQAFISAEFVRSIRLSTIECQVFSVGCIACDSYPLALSLIGRTRNWPYSIYLNRGCACVVHVSCCRDRARVRSSGSWHARTRLRSIDTCHTAATIQFGITDGTGGVPDTAVLCELSEKFHPVLSAPGGIPRQVGWKVIHGLPTSSFYPHFACALCRRPLEVHYLLASLPLLIRGDFSRYVCPRKADCSEATVYCFKQALHFPVEIIMRQCHRHL